MPSAKFAFVIICLCATIGASVVPRRCIAQYLNGPPKVRVEPVEDEYFGTRVADPNRWMEAPGNVELQSWLKGQAQYANAVLERIPGRSALKARIHELDQPSIVIRTPASA